MAAATVFCAFLAPFFALVIGLALVTFTPLKRASSANKFISTALFVGGITALGWAPLLLSDSVGVWAYSGVLVLSSLYQAVVILFVSAEVLTDHSVEQDHPGASRTSGAREQSVLMSPHGQSNGAPLAQRMEAAQTDKQAAPRMESCSALPPCPKPALVSRQKNSYTSFEAAPVSTILRPRFFVSGRQSGGDFWDDTTYHRHPARAQRRQRHPATWPGRLADP